MQYDHDDYDDDDYAYMEGECYAQQGSALRCASASNPRNMPCPTCGAADVLTPADVRLGYQCDECANRAEGLLPQY